MRIAKLIVFALALTFVGSSLAACSSSSCPNPCQPNPCDQPNPCNPCATPGG